MTTISVAERPLTSSITSPLAVQRNPARRGPVLLAADVLDSAQAAAQAARDLAQRLNVPLHVVTVIDPWPYHSASVGMWPIPMPPETDIREARAQSTRRYLEESIGDKGWTLEVRLGQGAREIRSYAREIDASAVVLSAAPHRLLGQTVTGTRAAQVLRGAPCPVLSVVPDFNGLPRKLLAAVDFSPASMRAAQTALMFAADDAEVTLVYVAPNPVFVPPAATLADRADELFAHLRQQLAPYTPERVVISTRVLQGEVVQQLLEFADSLGADLVAVGTHGPGFVERLFIGSTAANTLHLARCSVLASPAPPPQEAIELELHVRGTVTMSDPKEWAGALDAVSKRDTGRVVNMEVDDRDVGAQIEASGYVLQGITFDPYDRRVAIMLQGPGTTGGHLTRSIPNVDSVAITSGPDGHDSALAIKHGRGQTLLLFTA